jgi:RNA polymerase sigma factor (sigma-70 family)
MSDLEGRFGGGDEKAFEEIIGRYSRKVYGLCYRMLRDQEEARDMAQDVFVRVYTKRRSFKGKSSLYTWIYRIAVNMCLSSLKKRKVQMVPLDQIEPILKARDDTTAGRVDLERLIALGLKELPPKQKAVFVMRFYEKMTFREVSEAMGTSVGAAKANYHFAVERLRRLVGGREGES